MVDTIGGLKKLTPSTATILVEDARRPSRQNTTSTINNTLRKGGVVELGYTQLDAEEALVACEVLGTDVGHRFWIEVKSCAFVLYFILDSTRLD